MTKPIAYLSLLTLGCLANPAWAQADGGLKFSAILLTIAILLGLIASLYVFTLSMRLAGGQIAGTLALYGLGMLGVVISLLSVTWMKPYLGPYAGTAHDLFFIVGFLVMVIGSSKLAAMFPKAR